MKNLSIKGGLSMPKIDLNFATGKLSISGESYPENAKSFYSPIIDWIEENLEFTKNVEMDVKLKYFNSSSSKALMDVLDVLDGFYNTGKRVKVNWWCESENISSVESAEEFAEDLRLPFNILKEENL